MGSIVDFIKPIDIEYVLPLLDYRALLLLDLLLAMRSYTLGVISQPYAS